MPTSWRHWFASRAGQILRVTGRRKHLRDRLARLVQVVAVTPERRYIELISIFNELGRAALYDEVFLQQLVNHDPAEHITSALSRCQGRDLANAASLVDLETYLPGDLCHKVDMATMAHGLECRQPLLDHRLVEFAVALPANFKLRGGRGKWILRRAFGELLPREVLQRPKSGFGVPLDEWFRGTLRELLCDTLLSDRAADRGLFNSHEVARLIGEHGSRRCDHSHRLWLLLMLELWHRRWFDAPHDRS